MKRDASLENIGIVLISLLLAIASIYALKLLGFLMPLLAILSVRSQGGIKNISLYLPFPIVIIFLLLLWIVITIFWTSFPVPALKTFINLCFIFSFSLLLISSATKATPSLIAKAYTIMKLSGFFLMLLIVVQLCLDHFHIEIKKSHWGVYMMKPTGSILGLVGFVGCAFLWIYGHKIMTLLTAFLLVTLIYLTLCQTAFYGVILSIGIFIISYAFPFWVTRFSMIAIYTFLILSPVFSTYIMSPEVILGFPYSKYIINNSLFHRILAWEYFSEKFFEQPFWGWGLESARYIPTESEFSSGNCNLLHPHNNSVQAYAELGLVGGVLFSLFFASLFWLAEKHVKDRLSVAVCNATLIFGFTTAEVTNNLWHAYWLSLVALTAGLIILFLKAREAQLRASIGHSKQRPAL